MSKSKATLKKEALMFNGDLPIVKAKVRTGYDSPSESYLFEEIDVEVLTVNFNTGGMRVRYLAVMFNSDGDTSIQSCDISNEPYMKMMESK